MLVGEAKAIGREWVRANGALVPGFKGAFFHGSTNCLKDEDRLPPSSDIDVLLVVDSAQTPAKLGKFIEKGVLLEVSAIAAREVSSPELVLATYRLAGSFRGPSIIADPTGELAALQAVVSRDYAKRRWVERRCADARANVRRYLSSFSAAASFADQVIAWLFATGVTTHILLVAGLRNPTVRRRYQAVRELLAEYGRTDFYEEMLRQLGCVAMTKERAEHHLAALTETFDTAATAIRSPFAFAADISQAGRPVAIEGSCEMIASGNHREAVFWLVATYWRCLNVLEQDAPADVRDRYLPGFESLLGDVGIASSADVQRRCAEVARFVPDVCRVAEVIMDAHPEIRAAAG